MTSFAPETLFYIKSFPITNTIISTLFVDLVLLAMIFFVNRKLSLIPGKFQNGIEYVIGGFYGFIESIAGPKTAKIFPYFMTFFFFILIANWSGLIPGISTFGIYQMHEGFRELVPIYRSATSDLNTTLALAIVSLVATHIMAIIALGPTEYLSRFVPFLPFLISVVKGKPKFNIDKSGPINFAMSFFSPVVLVFVGLLELISEFVKVISLSFRLFGNITAGEVVLNTVSKIFAFIFPLPFLSLELIVGVVQALVFAMLTMVFMVILTTSHSEEEHKEVSSA